MPGAKNIVINEVSRLSVTDHAVELYNYGPAQDMTSWTLTYYIDNGGSTTTSSFTFPNFFTLDRHALVTIHWAAGTNTATDLYRGIGALAMTVNGELALENNAAIGVDYLAWGAPAPTNLPPGITWNGNVSWGTTTNPVQRVRDLNTRGFSDWTNSTSAASLGSLYTLQTGSRRHSRVMINEFSIGATDWVEIYNPNPFQTYLTGGRLEAYNGAATPCYTSPVFSGTPIAIGGFLIVTLPAGCNWGTGLAGEIRLLDAANEGWDYIAFNAPATNHLPAGVTWIGDATDIVMNSAVFPYGVRSGDLDGDNYREWSASSGTTQNALNPNQQGPGIAGNFFRYDELGSDASVLFVPSASGRGSMLDVDAAFVLKEYKVRLNLPATRDVRLVVKKRTATGPDVWAEIYNQLLSAQPAANGVFTSGLINLAIDSPYRYSFMVYVSDTYTLYRSNTNTEAFRYGTGAGFNGDGTYPPIPTSPPTNQGIGLGALFSYYLTDDGPDISPLVVGPAEVGLAYSQTFSSTAGPVTTWSYQGGAIPGLAFVPATRTLSGTPTTAGSYPFSIQATDAAGASDTQSYTLTVLPAVTITTTTLPQGEIGFTYSTPLTVTGGAGSNVWSVSAGALPTGVSLIPATGTLSGTPTVIGTFNFTARVQDSLGAFDTQALTLIIQPAVTITSTSPLPGGSVGAAYNYNFTRSGGVGPYVWDQVSGLQPNGLLLLAGGVLSGTPQVAGSFTFSVRITDSYGATHTVPFTLTITQPLMILNDVLSQGVIGTSYPGDRLIAAGGALPYSFARAPASPPLPPGLSLSTSGQLSGVPTITGGFPVTFRVTDSAAAIADWSTVLTIGDPPNLPQWSKRGQSGGDLREVQVSPNYAVDATLFVTGPTGEFFRSGDQGASWSRLVVDANRAGDPFYNLRMSPVYDRSAPAASLDAHTLFITGTYLGVNKSTDDGASFTAVNSGLPVGGQTSALAISPNYAADRTLWVAVNNSIYRSQDAAVSWSLVHAFAGFANYDFFQIAVSPAYATDQTLFLFLRFTIQRSLDGGFTWTQRYAYPVDSVMMRLVISPDYVRDHTVFAEKYPNLLVRSRDGGGTFAPLATQPAGGELALAARPGLTPRLFLIQGGNPYGLLYSDDYGDTVASLYAGGMDTNGGSSSLDRIAPSSSYGAGQIDIFSVSSNVFTGSFDGGFAFMSRMNGLTAVAGANLSGLGQTLVASSYSGWLKSGDGGLSWVLLKAPNGSFTDLAFISPHYDLDGVIFLAVTNNPAELFRSDDGGQSFNSVKQLAVSTNPLALAASPDFNGAAGIGDLFWGNSDGIYKFSSGGTVESLIVPPSPDCWGGSIYRLYLSVSPNYASDRTVFLGTTGGTGGVCRSTDGGTTWIPIKPNGNPMSGALFLSPSYNNNGADGTQARQIMRIGSDANIGWGLYRSMNGGGTWTRTTGQPTSPATGAIYEGTVAYSPLFATDNTLLVGVSGGSNSSDGIWRSGDGGGSVARLVSPDALFTRQVNGLYLVPGFNGNNMSNSFAVALTGGAGAWRSSDGGRSFQINADYQFISKNVNAIVRVPGGVQGITGGGNRPFIGPKLPDAVSAGSLLAATAGQGVFQSDDGGITYYGISRGLPRNADITTIIAPAGAPFNPIAAVLNLGLWRYSGTAWAQIATAASGNFTSFAEDTSLLYATRSNGPSLKSLNSGVAWTTQNTGVTDLTNIDFNNSILPTLADESGAGKMSPRPDAPSAVTASLWSVAVATGAKYSLDSGANWIGAPGGGDYPLPQGSSFTTVKALGINPASTGRDVLVGHASLGLYKSNDGGASWRSVSGPGSGLEATSKNVGAMITTQTPQNSTDMLVGMIGSTTGGVYLSADGGEHWTQINQGFDPNNLNITTLAKTSCSGCPVQYYSGTYGSGVYTRTIAVVAAPTISSWCFTGTGCACGTAAASGGEGQAFRLCGANFLVLPVVEFDGIPATGCAWVSSSVITCTGTPVHWAGAAVVRVRNTDTRTGYMPQNFTFNGGGARASSLTVAKSGNNAVLNYTCTGCTSPVPQIYRSQNKVFTLNVETYTGGATTYTNTGALAAGSNDTYFWSVE